MQKYEQMLRKNFVLSWEEKARIMDIFQREEVEMSRNQGSK